MIRRDNTGHLDLWCRETEQCDRGAFSSKYLPLSIDPLIKRRLEKLDQRINKYVHTSSLIPELVRIALTATWKHVLYTSSLWLRQWNIHPMTSLRACRCTCKRKQIRHLPLGDRPRGLWTLSDHSVRNVCITLNLKTEYVALKDRLRCGAILTIDRRCH